MSAQGECLTGGGCLPEGGVSPYGQIDACENIIFPQLLLRTVTSTHMS